jgi:integrase
MIEDFFEHPYTLRYLCSGVTGPRVDAFAVTLTEQGFTKDRARGLLRGVAHLGRWLQKRGTPLVALDEGVLEAFRAHLSRCRCVRRNKGRLYYCRSGSNRFLSPDVVDQIVASCDPATARGRRDRAVLLLLTRLGLRAGDVAGMRLGDLDWSEATLTVFGKSRREVRLPLPQEVGDAILAWLSGGRPDRDDHVFFGLRAPIVPLTRSSVATIAASAARRADATMPRVGTHMLRHSAATAWLRGGLSLPAIGALLRHRSQETTAIYAKVDVDLLRTVVRPWPEEVLL